MNEVQIIHKQALEKQTTIILTMKLKTIIATLFMLVGIQTAWAQTVILSLSNNQTVEYDLRSLRGPACACCSETIK